MKTEGMPEMTDLPEETVVDPAADEHVNEWERLHLIVESGDSAVAHAYLHSLPPGDIARLLGRVSEDEQRSFLTVLSEHDAADVIETLPELQAAQLMAVLPPEKPRQSSTTWRVTSRRICWINSALNSRKRFLTNCPQKQRAFGFSQTITATVPAD
jgi:Mg/Co/Ni transporter MgtE